MILDELDGSIYQSDLTILGYIILLVCVGGMISAGLLYNKDMAAATAITSIIAAILIVCGWYQESKKKMIV